MADNQNYQNDKELSQKLTRRVRINPFLTNFGDFNWSVFALSFLITYITILPFIMFAFYYSLGDDVYQILTKVENEIITYYKYFISQIFTKLNNANHINDFFYGNIVNFNIKAFDNFKLEQKDYMIFTITAVINFKFYIASILQFYYQRKIKAVGFMNYYVPIVFIYFVYQRIERKALYIRLLDILKLEPLKDKATVNSIKQVFFNIPYKDVDNYEIIKEDQSFMGWYNFQIWHLEEVENDEKKETDSNDDIDDEDEKIELKKRLTRKQKKALRNS